LLNLAVELAVPALFHRLGNALIASSHEVESAFPVRDVVIEIGREMVSVKFRERMQERDIA